MIGAGVHEWALENLGRQRTCPLNGRSEIVDLKPEEDTVSVRSGGWIAHVWMLVGVPVMELKDELPPGIDELLVLGASMPALAAEQALVPAATCLVGPAS
jgi:hypothetical protein